MYYTLKKIAKRILFSTTPHIPYNRTLYLNDIKYRARLPFTSILELSRPISFLSAFTYEKHVSNDFYGHATVLKKFCKIPVKYQFKFSIEHGVFISRHITKLDIDSPFGAIATFGAHRVNLLRQYKSFPFAIGPYISYATALLTKKQMANEKKRLGKSLLVFPSHSSSEVKTTYDTEVFCKKIASFGKNFDSIRICLYWKDILDESYKVYKKYGFECITAWHVLDTNFLPRLKSIIETSSYTLSNDPGTHVGYCISLHKPHYLLKQNFTLSGLKSEVELVKNTYKDENMGKIMEIFKKPSQAITGDQLAFVNTYWGLDQVKSRYQMLRTIEKTEKMHHEKH